MANLGAALGAVSFILLIVGAVLFFAIKRRRPLAKTMLVAGAVTFVLAIVVTPQQTSLPGSQVKIAATPSSAEAPPSESLPVTVRDAGRYGTILNLDLDFGELRSGAILTNAGSEVIRIGRALIEGRPPYTGRIDTINFVVLGKAGGDDRVGRQIAHFSYPAQELRQLAHIGLDGDVVLDAARNIGTWTPSNDDVIDEYCSDRPSSSFCKAAK